MDTSCSPCSRPLWPRRLLPVDDSESYARKWEINYKILSMRVELAEEAEDEGEGVGGYDSDVGNAR